MPKDDRPTRDEMQAARAARLNAVYHNDPAEFIAAHQLCGHVAESLAAFPTLSEAWERCDNGSVMLIILGHLTHPEDPHALDLEHEFDWFMNWVYQTQHADFIKSICAEAVAAAAAAGSEEDRDKKLTELVGSVFSAGWNAHSLSRTSMRLAGEQKWNYDNMHLNLSLDLSMTTGSITYSASWLPRLAAYADALRRVIGNPFAAPAPASPPAAIGKGAESPRPRRMRSGGRQAVPPAA